MSLGDLGIVAIGRNEGERLRACLESVVGRAAVVVYVDSGSTDGSVALARSLGAEVVELDPASPFTAARARNAGLERLRALRPGLRYVQFIDGDCDVVEGWLDRARAALEERPDVAIVCGRRRERYPEASLYNRLADLEWGEGAGEVESSGGDSMARVEAMETAGGFDPVVAAGEEPELCWRLRRAGWKILRLDAGMTRHDLEMSRIGQWWRRRIRTGRGALDVFRRCGGGRAAPFARQIRSTRIWTIGWAAALAVAVAACATGHAVAFAAALAVALAPAAQALRVAARCRRRVDSTATALAYGVLMVVGKWAEWAGHLGYYRDRAAGRGVRLIEYKGSGGASGMSGRHSSPDNPAVAYLVSVYPQPSQTFIRREIAAMEAAGWTVHRFSLRRWDGPLPDEADEAERRLTRALLSTPLALLAAALGDALMRPGALLGALRLAMRMGRRSERGVGVHMIYLAEACLLRRRLAGCGAGHLHAHFGTNSAAVAQLCRRLGGPPYSFTAHGSELADAPRTLSFDEKVRDAAFAVAVADYGRSQLCRWSAPADWQKIHVVRCGLDGAFLAGEPAPIGPEPRLVCVGRLSPEKGQLVLLEAAALLRDRGVTFELKLVGDGPLRPDLERHAESLDLGERVRFAGWRDGAGVRRELSAARALVLPSFAEGLPVVLMEALAVGRPVVATYVGAIPELVRPGREGWLVPPGSAEALAEALAECLAADPSELARMGRSGRDRVARRHDGAVEAARLADLIRLSASPSTSSSEAALTLAAGTA